MFSIITVCTGNICRSPMAEYQLRNRFEAAGLTQKIQVDSAATTPWESGNPMDRRAQQVLAQHGIPSGPRQKSLSDHRARTFRTPWFTERDLILAMDSGHYEYLMKHSPATERHKIRMIRDFDPQFSNVSPSSQLTQKSIEDPWYGDISDFSETYRLIDASLEGIIEYRRQNR